MGQRAQQGLEWLVVLQAAEHGSKNQHDGKRGAVLSEVESLKTDLADAINAKPCEHMHDVVRFFEPVNDESFALVTGEGSIRVSGVIPRLIS